MDAQKTLRERYLTLVRIIYLETFDPRTFRLQTPQKVRVAGRQQFGGAAFAVFQARNRFEPDCRSLGVYVE